MVRQAKGLQLHSTRHWRQGRLRSYLGGTESRHGRLPAVEFATLEWVDWFNNRRLLEPIGNIPPAEAEERYYAMLAETAVAA